jgi:hypothetical protein
LQKPSFVNCLVNLLAGLIAYSFQEKKPSLGLRLNDPLTLPIAVFWFARHGRSSVSTDWLIDRRAVRAFARSGCIVWLAQQSA